MNLTSYWGSEPRYRIWWHNHYQLYNCTHGQKLNNWIWGSHLTFDLRTQEGAYRHDRTDLIMGQYSDLWIFALHWNTINALPKLIMFSYHKLKYNACRTMKWDLIWKCLFILTCNFYLQFLLHSFLLLFLNMNNSRQTFIVASLCFWHSVKCPKIWVWKLANRGDPWKKNVPGIPDLCV
jgi:hypothetical protein